MEIPPRPLVQLGTSQPTKEKPVRYCFLMHVRPELLPEYSERHAAVWPDMLRALARRPHRGTTEA